MDRIDEIVDRAIQYTEDILKQAPRHFRSARDGLVKMRDNLTFGANDHSALGRLDDYIGELDRRFARG
jgi:hypothetical protein